MTSEGKRGAIVGFDLTIEQTPRKEGGKELRADELGKALKMICKKFVFQLEEGTEKKIKHYQVRCLFISKTTQANALKLFIKAINSPDHKDYTTIRPTCTATYNARSFSYVMKLDGRIGETYTDSNFGGEPEEYEHIPRELENIKESSLYPFQIDILKMARTYDYRTIDFIIDPIGNNGKSIICDFLEIYENCHIIPCVNDYKLIVQDAGSFALGLKKIYGDGKESKCRNIKAFLCDMPRGINEYDTRNIISALETVKSGRLAEYRYQSRIHRINAPRVFVFCNTCPDLSFLSKDRYNLWIIKDKHLKVYIPPLDLDDSSDSLFEKEPKAPRAKKSNIEDILFQIERENSKTPDFS